MKPNPEVSLASGTIPGAIGRITELHGTCYHAHWGFGPFFGAKVAAELSEQLSELRRRIQPA